MISLLPLVIAGCVTTGAHADGAPPPPNEGLVAWFDASREAAFTLDGDRVSSWASSAGTAPALVAAGNVRPRRLAVTGRGPSAAVSLDGRNDALRAAGVGMRSETWTLIAVFAPLPRAHGAIASACPAGGDDYDPGFTVDLFGAANGFDYLSVEGAGRQDGRLNQRTGKTPPGVFTVVTVIREPERVRLFVDGKEEASRPASPALTIIDELRLGARHFGGRDREYLHGEVAELMLYDHALTETQQRAIEAPRIVTDAERLAGEEYGKQMAHPKSDGRMIRPEVTEAWPSEAAYIAARERGQVSSGPPLPLQRLPFRTDLLEAMRLCMHCLNNSFDRDKDDEPFFYSNHRNDGTGEFHHSVVIGIPHVVGRCLVGSMSASLATGMPFPADGLAILTRHLKSSFDNPDHLNSYFDPEHDNRRFIEFHNMREGLYGLWAMLQTPEAPWAREAIGRMLTKLDSLTDETGRWNPERFKEQGMSEYCSGISAPNAARVVDPLLAVYRETGDPLALKLAGLYSKAGLEEMVGPDGHFTEWQRSSGHVHSITSSLSGITEYALLTGDAAMLATCKLALNVGMWDYFSSWGWGDEVFPDHPADEVLRGEINQTGDVVRMALHLGAAGEPRYYELAEVFVRDMLLPTQHREPELRAFMHDNPSPASDAERDVINRTVGGYAMQLPNDRMAEGDWPLQTQDITSGASHAFAEFWRHRVTEADGVASVNLLFDYEGEALTVRSELPLRGRLTAAIRKPLRLRVRVPEWVDVATLRVAINHHEVAAKVEGGYAMTDALAAGDEVTVTFEVPCRIERETVDGAVFTTTWVGNQIVDIQPRGTVSPLPF